MTKPPRKKPAKVGAKKVPRPAAREEEVTKPKRVTRAKGRKK